MGNTIGSRAFGFVASLILTLTAFLLIVRPAFFPLEKPMIIAILLCLAVCQAIVQSIFFLHILQEKKPRWNLIIFASTICIILVIVVFSMWIMHHLNYNMMPHQSM
jgi:cytochrome o ubiquinol oxidase operon protein cyoD